MFPLQSIAKALVGAAVTAGAAYAGLHGVPVPAEVQGWASDSVMMIVAGLLGGGAVWAIPNTTVKQKKNKKAQ